MTQTVQRRNGSSYGLKKVQHFNLETRNLQQFFLWTFSRILSNNTSPMAQTLWDIPYVRTFYRIFGRMPCECSFLASSDYSTLLSLLRMGVTMSPWSSFHYRHHCPALRWYMSEYSAEAEWQGKPKTSKRNMSQCLFVHHKSRMGAPGENSNETLSISANSLWYTILTLT